MLLALGLLAVLGIVVAFLAWDRWVEDRLARWAVAEVDRRTGGTYRLHLGDLAFLPLAGSISFDSAIVTTDSARNRRRPAPLPGLAWRGHECHIRGVDVPRLLLRRTFVARELGCDRVATTIALPSPAEKKERLDPDSARPAESAEDRPLGLSSIRVADVSFPALSVTLTRPGDDGGTSVLLEHARFEGKELAVDPAADPRSGRAVSAGRARLTATGLVFRPDSMTALAIAALDADLTGANLLLAGAKHEPDIPEDEWVRRVRIRRDRIRFELDSARARGLDWRTLVATGDIAVRAVELSGLRLDVLTDRRIPKGRPRRHRTPQQVAASPGPALRVDSLVVAGGTITYRERKPERERPGQVSFDALHATMLDLDLPSRGKPLRIEARARVMGEGLLTVEATVPLDAPDFRYELAGKLGKMPAAAFNRFLSANEAFEFGEGWVEEIAFRQTARAGRTVTTLTPRYRDLSVKPTGDGGGVLGSVKRAVKKFVANAFVVHDRNPDEDGENLRTARTVRRYDPASTWVQFLWVSLRDGLMEALKE